MAVSETAEKSEALESSDVEATSVVESPVCGCDPQDAQGAQPDDGQPEGGQDEAQLAAEQIERQLEDLEEMVAKNPASRSLFAAALASAREPLSHDELADQLDDVYRPSTCTQTPRSAIGALVRHGGLRETILVDGEPYEGTREDFRNDDAIPEDARVEYLLSTTSAGERLLATISSSSRIQRLFDSRPEHARVFTDVLAFCDTSDGRTRDEIAEYLKGDGDALHVSPQTGFPTVYPAFYTGALEDVGALAWRGRWRLTKEGEDFLHALS